MFPVISCSNYSHISPYITVRNSCQEKRVSNWFFFFIEKHGFIYLVCYYKYSSSRLWLGEFHAHWGQWKSGTWLQQSQNFHPDFCLFRELELTVIVDKYPGTAQVFWVLWVFFFCCCWVWFCFVFKAWFSHFSYYQIMTFSNCVKAIQTTEPYVLLGFSFSFKSLPVVICVMIGSRSPSHR